jgi:heterodisulfide reductase subunit C
MLGILQQLLFVLALAAAGYMFSRKAREIYQNIIQGKAENRNDNPNVRLKNMLLLAFGQQKMFKKPIAAILHFFVYVGFLLINIEVAEIVLDGILGTHRLFAPYLGGIYAVAINFFEFLAVAVLLSCVVFLVRRNVLKVPRLAHTDLHGFPAKDANRILFIEITLMFAVLVMNATDQHLQGTSEHYHTTGHFFFSGLLMPLFANCSVTTLEIIERLAWWAHILGIFAFLNYLPYSKHLHILLAFPNSYFGDLESRGKIKNMPRITQEIQLMLDPSLPTPEEDPNAAPERFGAKDVQDLSWKSLLDAYSCTECGRCTAACPANQTGKLLSPRKVMMATRDRMEDKAAFAKNNSNDADDGKSLHNYISIEELRACTTCNACVEECPVSINPLTIILEMRRYLILEESKSPEEWNLMFNNIETNGAVWKMPAENRANWVTEL